MAGAIATKRRQTRRQRSPPDGALKGMTDKKGSFGGPFFISSFSVFTS